MPPSGGVLLSAGQYISQTITEEKNKNENNNTRESCKYHVIWSVLSKCACMTLALSLIAVFDFEFS